MFWILWLISLWYITGSIIWFFFSTSYIAELRLSFLPYRMWCGWILCILLLLLIWRIWKKKWLWLYIFWLLALVVLLCTWVYTSRYITFYIDDVWVRQDWEGISFLYANIRYKNHEIDELVMLIADRDPELIFFVEYTPDHHRELYPQLEEEYPYINTEYPTQGPAGKVVLSKLPFENLAPSLWRAWWWRYGYISLVSESTEFIFYVVHTTSPISPRFFAMRNEQLDLLVNDIHAHDYVENYASVVSVLWDFNVSPWSPSYNRLAWKRDDFDNMTRFLPWLMTWWLPWGWIRSHIDHVWMNKPDALLELEYIPLIWSDHDALFGRIWY